MITLSPLHSWLLVVGAIVIGIALIFLMLAIDNHLNRRAARREQEREDTHLAPVTQLRPNGRTTRLRLVQRAALAPNQKLYDWRVQGL